MKKRFLTVILMTVLCFTGCGASDKTNDDIGQLQEEMEAIQSEIEQLQSEKSELQAELSQQTTTVTTVPVTTVTTTETSKVIDAPANDWELEYLESMWGPSETCYRVGYAEGTYNTSKIKDGYLKVKMECMRNRSYDNTIKDSVGICLYIDGDRLIVNEFADPANVFDITVTEEDGSSFTIEGRKTISGAYAITSYEPKNKHPIINAMKNNDVPEFHISQGKTTYDYVINCIGFEEAFDSSPWDI